MSETTRGRARLRGWHLFAAVAVAAVAVPIGIAGANHDGNSIHACVRDADGAVRIVSSDADCRAGETARTWNEQGPTGPAGPSGPAGPAGPAGSDGSDGGGGVALPPNAEAFLTCEGSKQGSIDGGSSAAGHEDAIEIIGYSHEVLSPRDAASGLPTGKRQHKPFVVTKTLDESTPKLALALVTTEMLSSCTLELVNSSEKGRETYFTIKLTNASIAGITQEQSLPNTAEPTSPLELEKVSFTYQKISWTWHDGGITAEDSWSTSA